MSNELNTDSLTKPIDFLQLARDAGLLFNEDSGTEVSRLRHEERIVIFASKVLEEACK